MTLSAPDMHALLHQLRLKWGQFMTRHCAACWLWSALAVPLSVFALMLIDWEATFSCEVQTEVIEVRSRETHFPRWFVAAAEIYADGEEKGTFTGSIQLRRNVFIRFERTGSGPLFVIATPLPGHESAETGSAQATPGGEPPPALAVLRTPDERVHSRIRQELVLRVDPAHRKDEDAARIQAFPFEGRATVGQPTRDQTAPGLPMLISGTVRIFGKSFFGDPFKAGEALLELGDTLQVEGRAKQAANGIVRLDWAPALRLIYHATGNRARVIRFGSEGYSLTPSLWLRFASDPVFVAFAALAISLLPALAGASIERLLCRKERP